MQLKEIIVNEIQRSGPISFHDFMEMALYYPDLGYYTTDQKRIGKEGDFFTSSSLTSSYGAILAKQMEEMWHALGRPDFTIVEYGAGLGTLCQDIMDELFKNTELFRGLRYCIIEKSDIMRQYEQVGLMRHPNVSWYASIAEIPGVIDCVFSNELFDNFPIHQVIMKEQLMEIFVDFKDGFAETLRPASQELKDYFKRLEVSLPLNYRTEVNLEALNWIKDIAAALERGFIMTIDYGDVSERLYKPHNKDGNVVCYKRHAVSEDPYAEVGEQDITAHINFSALKKWGRRSGLDTCGMTSQALFLSSLGFQEHLRETMSKAPDDLLKLARQASYISYTLLFEMGNKYKVLIQSKGLPEMHLTGLQFAN